MARKKLDCFLHIGIVSNCPHINCGCWLLLKCSTNSIGLLEPKLIVELHTFLAGHPTDEQLRLLNILSNNHLPSLLFEWKELLLKKAQINGCQSS